MSEKKTKIEWRNIYYMLSYAIDEFPYLADGSVSFENIESIMDLLAVLLDESFKVIYSQQILRQYSIKNLNTNRPKGNINIEKSYQTGVIGKGKLNCDVFIFDIDNIYNQAIKAGFFTLLECDTNSKNSKVSFEIKSRLLQDLNLLAGVTRKPLTLKLVQNSSQVPSWYKPMRAALQMIYENCLASDKEGEIPLYELGEERRLCWIFEKFVRNYCAKTFGLTNELYVSQPYYYEKRSKSNDRKCELDLLLENETSALIVDMKWYERREHGSAENMRQIKEYMQGYQLHKYGKKYDMVNVNGLLLYAGTNTGDFDCEESHLDNNANMSKIYWQTLGLNQDWDLLKRDLNQILLKRISKVNLQYNVEKEVNLNSVSEKTVANSNLKIEESIISDVNIGFTFIKSSNSNIVNKVTIGDDKKDFVYHVVLVGKGFDEVRRAEGTYDFSTGTFKLFAGAELCPPELYVDSYIGRNGKNNGKPTKVYLRYKDAVNSGDIKDNKTVRDLMFRGPSTPCSWYLGRAAEGFLSCIADDGRTLYQIREDLGISVTARNRY